jgi:hypothetical protein
MLQISLDNSIMELGQPITGQVSWQSGKSSSQPLKIKVGWRREGRGSKQQQTVTTLELGQLFSGCAVPFRCDLPYKAPISFDGKLFRVIWEVSAEAQTGIWGGETQTVPIQVIPRRSQL